MEGLKLQSHLCNGFLLRKFGRIEPLVGQPKLLNLVVNQFELMLLLGDLLIPIFHICFKVTFLVLKLLDLICLFNGLILQVSRQLITPHCIILLLAVVSCLHLRLLDKHFLLDLVDFLLFFDFHLVYYSAIFLSELVYVVHELLIRVLGLLVSLFNFLMILCQGRSILVVLICELLIAHLGLFVLSGEVFLDGFIITLFEFQPQMIRRFKLVRLHNLELSLSRHSNLKHAYQHLLA